MVDILPSAEGVRSIVEASHCTHEAAESISKARKPTLWRERTEVAEASVGSCEEAVGTGDAGAGDEATETGGVVVVDGAEPASAAAGLVEEDGTRNDGGD
jgi:hypothetical protein